MTQPMTPNDERAQIRAEAVRECIDALPHGPVGLDPGVTSRFQHGLAQIIACRCALTALLRPDPAEASEPLAPIPPLEPWRAGVTLNDKNEWVQPSPAAAHGEAGTLHEPTVRACIEALPEWRTSEGLSAVRKLDQCRAALEALLPKPDPAKDLVDEWLRACPANSDTIEHVQGGSSFAFWAINSGRLKP